MSPRTATVSMLFRSRHNARLLLAPRVATASKPQTQHRHGTRGRGPLQRRLNDALKYRTKWCRRTGSNRRPPDYKSGALPTELLRRRARAGARRRGAAIDKAHRRRGSSARRAKAGAAAHRCARLGGKSALDIVPEMFYAPSMTPLGSRARFRGDRLRVWAKRPPLPARRTRLFGICASQVSRAASRGCAPMRREPRAARRGCSAGRRRLRKPAGK
jgi:hypothetical protein